MELKPSLEDFCRLAKKRNLIAISTEINMDLDTPVSVYYKLAGDQ
jgi:anthranilate synthase component 1